MLTPIAIIASAALLAGEVPSQTDGDKEKIIGLEAELGRAMVQRDTGALRKIVGDDWLCQGATGISTKKSFIGDVETGKLVVTKFALHNIHVEVFGNVAYLMGADDEVSSYNGTNNSGTYNWLDVWTKRDGRWVSVATQITKAVQKR